MHLMKLGIFNKIMNSHAKVLFLSFPAFLCLFCSCDFLQDEDRLLQKRLSRMFDGYGTWAWGCLHLASREVISGGNDTVILQKEGDTIENAITFVPPVDGRLVVFEEPPDWPRPVITTLSEFLFVGEDGNFRVVLYRGSELFSPFWETDGERKTFTWIQFWCRPNALRTEELTGSVPLVTPPNSPRTP